MLWLEALGLNKWLVYITLFAAIVGSFFLALSNAKNSGSQFEKNKSAKAALERMKQNAQIKLDVERTLSTVARERLRNKYSR